MRTKLIDKLMISCLAVVISKILLKDEAFMFLYEMLYPTIGTICIIFVSQDFYNKTFLQKIFDDMVISFIALAPFLLMCVINFDLNKVLLFFILMAYLSFFYFFTTTIMIFVSKDTSICIAICLSLSLYFFLYFKGISLYGIRYYVLIGLLIVLLLDILCERLYVKEK